MAYELVSVGSVTFDMPSQALRPREAPPRRPPVSGSRIARPREGTKGNPGPQLKLVAKYRAEQRACEQQVQVLGAKLRVCRAHCQKLKVSRASQSAVAACEAQCQKIEKQIAALIERIKLLAGKANGAAAGAIAAGSNQQVAIESSGITIGKDGRPIPTGTMQAAVIPPAGEAVSTPATAPDQEPVLNAQDVSVSSGSIFTLVVAAGAVGLAYLALRKKGHA